MKHHKTTCENHIVRTIENTTGPSEGLLPSPSFLPSFLPFFLFFSFLPSVFPSFLPFPFLSFSFLSFPCPFPFLSLSHPFSSLVFSALIVPFLCCVFPFLSFPFLPLLTSSSPFLSLRCLLFNKSRLLSHGDTVLGSALFEPSATRGVVFN